MKYKITDRYLQMKKSRRRATLIVFFLLVAIGLLLSVVTIVNRSTTTPLPILYTALLCLATIANHRILNREILELTDKTIDITDEAITEITTTRICRFPIAGIAKLKCYFANPRNEARFYIITKTGTKYFFDGFENKDGMMEELTSLKDKVKIVFK